MKNSASKFFVMALFFALTTILGCGGEEREPQAPPPQEEESMEHMEETIEEDENKAETEPNSLNEQQDSYIDNEQQDSFVDNVNEQMIEMGEKIQVLKEHAQSKEGEVREKLDQELDELTALYEKAAHELAHLKDQGMDAWSEAKPRMENAMDQLEQAYLDTKAKFE